MSTRDPGEGNDMGQGKKGKRRGDEMHALINVRDDGCSVCPEIL